MTFNINTHGEKMLASRSGAIGVGIVAVGLCAAGLVHAKPASDAVAARIMSALRAANEARSTNAEEGQAWRTEQDRLRLVHETIEQQIAQYAAEATESNKQIAALKAKREALDPKRQRHGQLSAIVKAQAEFVETALDTLASRAMLDTIAPRSPAAREHLLDNALRRLEVSEKNAANTAVTLATGKLAGEARSVELLRVGGVVAWWRSLDGTEAGTAIVDDGALVLKPATSIDDVQAILHACDIAKGRRAPAVVLLPVDHARKEAAR